MFIEPQLSLSSDATGRNRTGWIEIICGSMFSSKTEELIRRLNRARIARQQVEIFKPALDNRYHAENVVSHDANSIRSTPVQTAGEILLWAGNCNVVGIDEAQFLDEGIVDVANSLADSGRRVIIAGLDMDFQGRPFGCLPALMAIAEFVTKVHAICAVCGNVASYSFRLVPSRERVLLGETEAYQARCRQCFNEGMRQR